ncbi:MAG: alkaline phosphatase family protein [Candidatus Dormiibacterota bacterium]
MSRRMGRRMLGLVGGASVAAGLLVAQGANPTSPVRAATLGGAPASGLRPTSTQTACLQSTGSYTPPATAPHIMMIVDENTSYGASDGSPYVIGNSKAPYINDTLIKKDGYTSLTNWYSFEHNSPLDYMDFVSGCDHNGLSRPYTDPTVVNELDTAGFTWKAYMDGLAPSQTCYTGTGAGTNHYSQTHNPFIYFSQIINNSPECNANVVPYQQSQLSMDLNSTTPPDFVWITPNECNDMHSLCAPLNNHVGQGDAWLAANLPTVLNSSWYTKGNGIVIITFDEGASGDNQPGTSEGAGGHIATLVISQNSCGAYAGTGNNFATLRGIEEAYGVPLLNNASNATYGDITPAFADGACKGSGGTGTISGVVTNSQTALPIQGATVTCTCNNTPTGTDVNGNYSFTNVVVGTYSVTFSDPAFVTQIVNNVGVTSGNTTTVNAALVPASTSPPTVVQDVGVAAQKTSTSFSVTTSSTTAGDLLAISTESDAGGSKSSATVTGVTDNQGDVWMKAVAANPSTRDGAEIWYSPGANSGVTTVTVTYSKSVNPVVRFYEIANASALDATSAGSAKNTTPNTGTTVTTTTANEMVIGVIGFAPNTATLSGLTPGFANDPLLLNNLTNFNNAEQSGHEAVSSNGTFSYSGTLSTSASWAAVLATFR